MAKICPECGLSVPDDPKFCPGCGASMTPVQTDEEIGDVAPAEQPNTEEPITDKSAPVSNTDEHDPVKLVPQPLEDSDDQAEKRVFFLRGDRYGDTAEYDDYPVKNDSDKEKDAGSKHSTLSLYLSVFALVLSIAAIVLVVIFSVMPATQSSGSTEATAAIQIVTEAPTQPPTDPPITGEYSFSELQGEDIGLLRLIFSSSILSMTSDYTGTITAGGQKLADITLDKESNTCKMANSEGAFTFDGKVLAMTFNNITIVYKKDS